MSKINETEFKVLLVEHPQAPCSFFAKHFGVSDEAIRKKKKKLEKKLEAHVQVSNQIKVGEVVSTTKNVLEKDIETLRRIALNELKQAIDTKDKKALAVWYDKATANAKLRADISKSLNILIDNRTVNVTLIERRKEARDFLDGLLAMLSPGAAEEVMAAITVLEARGLVDKEPRIVNLPLGNSTLPCKSLMINGNVENDVEVNKKGEK
jgi:hypothetical protein